MATPQQLVLQQAASRIGYDADNDPNPGSEAGRYLASKLGQPWLRGPSRSIWWCMCFVSMCLDQAGQIKAIGGFFYNTDACKNANRSKIVSVANAQPGDVVIFNWNRDSRTDHVGLVERNLGNGWLQTIEGNVSGNRVMRKQRKSGIDCVIRPNYSGKSASSHKASTSKSSGKLVVDGIPGPATYTRLQQVMGTPVDGRKSWPSSMIEAFQKFLNSAIGPDSIRTLIGQPYLAVDGYDGYKTWVCFQYLAWCWHRDLVSKHAPGWGFSRWVDGRPGPATWKVLQEMLNLSKTGSGKLS